MSYSDKCRKAFLIACKMATHTDACKMIIHLKLADNNADADALIYEGEEMNGGQ